MTWLKVLKIEIEYRLTKIYIPNLDFCTFKLTLFTYLDLPLPSVQIPYNSMRSPFEQSNKVGLTSIYKWGEPGCRAFSGKSNSNFL